MFTKQNKKKQKPTGTVMIESFIETRKAIFCKIKR